MKRSTWTDTAQSEADRKHKEYQKLTSAKSFNRCVGSKTLRTNAAKSTFVFSYFLINGCDESCNFTIKYLLSKFLKIYQSNKKHFHSMNMMKIISY